jgi:uncharacterized protein (DUF1697 family)
MPPRTTVHVALLRGINVGGKHKLSMKQLVEVFENLGCVEVATYIQSGNVVFRAASARADRIPELVEHEIERRCGFAAPVITRTADELYRVATRNPFLRRDADVATLHVAFLAASPGAARLRDLDPQRSPPDEFAARGREIYLRCPNGVARSRLTNAYFDSKLHTTSTMRNWATVLGLSELTRP